MQQEVIKTFIYGGKLRSNINNWFKIAVQFGIFTTHGPCIAKRSHLSAISFHAVDVFFVMLDEMFAYDVLGAHVRLSYPVLTDVAKFLPSFSSFYSSFQLLNLSHQLLHLSIFMSSFNLPLHNFSIKYVINYIVIILVSDNSC